MFASCAGSHDDLDRVSMLLGRHFAIHIDTFDTIYRYCVTHCDKHTLTEQHVVYQYTWRKSIARSKRRKENYNVMHI
jgi:hypothetical protein